MKNNKIYFLIIGILFLNLVTLSAQNEDAILSSVKKEIDRNKEQLKIDKLQPPFFISYALVDMDYTEVKGNLGSIIYSRQEPRRLGYPNVLVGDFKQNNSGYMTMNNMYQRNVQFVSFENDPLAISTNIWAGLDRIYKDAAESFEAKKGILSQQNLDQEEKELYDFEKTPSININIPQVKIEADKAYWENFVKKSSEIFRKYPDLLTSEITLTQRIGRIFYYDTENSQFSIPKPYYRLILRVSLMTNDGQTITDELPYITSEFKSIPSLDNYIKECDHFVQNFLKLKDAPLINESYSGPVLFEKTALAETFRRFFLNDNNGLYAKRKPLAASDLNRYYSGSSFLKGNEIEAMMGKKVISRSLSVKSLTGTKTHKGASLEGYVPVDFQGVMPEPELVLVENGVLKNMLNDRIPTKKVKNSNGHSTFDYFSYTSKIGAGNAQLSCQNTFSNEDLKKKLLDAAREEDLEYAYIVRRQTQGPPIALYKIYVSDGREELVRGANFSDFNLKSFKRVLGASKNDFIYNSSIDGNVSTLIVPESLLFEELEITKDNNLDLKKKFIVEKPQ